MLSYFFAHRYCCVVEDIMHANAKTSSRPEKLMPFVLTLLPKYFSLLNYIYHGCRFVGSMEWFCKAGYEYPQQ